MRNWMFCSGSDANHLKIRLKICELEGLVIHDIPNKDKYKVQVHINLGVPKRGIPRIVSHRDHTSKQCVGPDGHVRWNEGFEHRCNLGTEGVNLKSWKINLEVHGIDVESNHKADILAKIKIDVTEFTGGSEKSVKLPVKCRIGGFTHDTKLKLKLDIIEAQKPQTVNTIHPISPTHLLPSLLSCVNFQNQTRNKTENMKMEMEIENSQSETEERVDPGYKRIKMLNLLRSQSSHEGTGYRKQDHEHSSSYEGTEKIKLTRLLSWNIRKPKDAPLLNKQLGGGDDIDNERRTLMSYLKKKDPVKSEIKAGEFMGSDRFEVGKWEKRRIKSRDGKLELETDMFLATIDQRSEKALGEGACTVIATVIADWLHKNPKNLPLRCEFDKLIRDGSREWRKLCEEETHKGKFLDQHFDLETVMQAQIRPLEVVSEKSYVGFFKLENMNNLDLLQDAMCFDSIWNELENGESSSEERVYIVSWNDHFFVLKKENKEMYVIDTLGERLAEGCKQAYILKFNEDSMIHNVEDDHSSIITCKGTSCCKEFIKGFLAAIPLGELQSNVEKGINGNAPLHRLLQIEFQYMSPLQQNL